ncbi:MAG: homoserine dehydrogenase [Chloroflexota bacterium]|nr:homoserine dehydrogenase [Chloroflexota bacterium]
MMRLTLIQVGIGTVGGAVVEQVIAHRERWRQELGIDLVVGAVVGQTGALVSDATTGLDDQTLRAVLTARRDGGAGLTDLARKLDLALLAPDEAIARCANAGPTVVSDAASGEQTAALDAAALAHGAGVVFSNKAPLALPLVDPMSAALWAEAGPRGRLRYEATCGAGLPVISTLRSLLETGDRPIQIQGALSGTFGAIFSAIGAGSQFGDAVRMAKERGYTEPDPRDDLSGLDVARKALILARTIGRPIDLREIAVESLVPEHLVEVEVAEFLARVGDADAAIGERATHAKRDGQALKYVATITPEGTLEVGMRAIGTDTVLGALQGPENIVSIRTERYDTYPCVISGPGAGAAVTAAGIVSDVLALARGPLSVGR